MSRSYRRDYSTWLMPFPKGGTRLNEEPDLYHAPTAGYKQGGKCKGKGRKTYVKGEVYHHRRKGVPPWVKQRV